jgi:uncharacterized GH25 family protein
MQPDKFRFNPGETATIGFKVGENFLGESWDLQKHRIETLMHHHKAKTRDYKLKVTEGEKDNLKVTLTEEGTHMIVMQSNDAFIALDGKKFNEYLTEDGLDDILYQREKEGILDDSSRELYSRHTKLLMQAGVRTDETFKKIIGLPVEIVPVRNPYTLKKGDPVKFRILYNGKPYFGAKVKVWNRYNNRTTMQNIFAQQDGTVETHISNPGIWMVSVVKMVPSKDPKAQYQSYWGSLVFEIR